MFGIKVHFVLETHILMMRKKHCTPVVKIQHTVKDFPVRYHFHQPILSNYLNNKNILVGGNR